MATAKKGPEIACEDIPQFNARLAAIAEVNALFEDLEKQYVLLEGQTPFDSLQKQNAYLKTSIGDLPKPSVPLP